MSATGRALSQYDVVYLILEELRPVFIVAPRSVNRLWADVCDHRLRCVFNPGRYLNGFIDDWNAFRVFMAMHDIVLAGPWAIDLFQPHHHSIASPSAPLELLVEHEMGNNVCSYLCNRGFSTVLDTDSVRPQWLPVAGASLIAVLRVPLTDRPYVRRVVTLERGGFSIEVCFTVDVPLVSLFRSTCTVALTFLTWDRAICMFPTATLMEHRGLVLKYGESHLEARYRALGFDPVRFSESNTLRPMGSLPEGVRWVGDGKSWIVPFSPHPALQTAPSSFNYLANGLSIYYTPAIGPSSTPGTFLVNGDYECATLEHESLLGSTYAVPHLFRSHFHDFIDNECRRLQHGLFWRYPTVFPAVPPRLLEVAFQFVAEMAEIPELMPP